MRNNPQNSEYRHVDQCVTVLKTRISGLTDEVASIYYVLRGGVLPRIAGSH